MPVASIAAARCGVLFAFLIGAALAAFANYCADALGWTPRRRSPWRRLNAARAESTFVLILERVPIVGWLFVARNESRRGATARRTPTLGRESRFFWARPLLTEALFGTLVAARFLFWRDAPLESSLVLLCVETIFFWILLCASLIDLDDCVIPDALTIPGALLGIACAGLGFSPCLPATPWPLDFSGETTPSFVEWTTRVFCDSQSSSSAQVCVLIAFAIVWSLWNFALLDRRFYLRLGIRRAFLLFFRRLRQSRLTWMIGAIWSLGLVALAFVVLRADFTAPNQTAVEGLALAFLGLATGALSIWCVRLIGGVALCREAMGFGDVILMGMIGAFVGWQGVLIVFFTAPFFGLVFGLLRRFINSDREIPYGPFLALATLVSVAKHDAYNEFLGAYFQDPVFLAGLSCVGFALLVALLILLRFAKGIWGARE